jgi:hypothetical protein
MIDAAEPRHRLAGGGRREGGDHGVEQRQGYGRAHSTKNGAAREGFLRHEHVSIVLFFE